MVIQDVTAIVVVQHALPTGSVDYIVRAVHDVAAAAGKSLARHVDERSAGRTGATDADGVSAPLHQPQASQIIRGEK